ncbi:LytR/AlgR family response regulator transcription factor [Sorangium sp. So ce118]
MKPLSALIIEDEWPARNFLVELLRDTGSFGDIAAVTSVEDARAVLERPELGIEVAFVDVRLVDRPGDRSGLDFARSLADLASPPAVVLATASAQYALDGFELGVVDYLLKPFTLDRITTCAARLLERRRPPTHGAARRRLVARKSNSLVFLDLDGMLAFQTVDRLTYVHHVDGVFSMDLSLNALGAALGSRVLRVHRNWLIAPAHAQGLSRLAGELIVEVGPTLRVPVSRDRAREVRQQLLENTVGIRQPG